MLPVFEGEILHSSRKMLEMPKNKEQSSIKMNQIGQGFETINSRRNVSDQSTGPGVRGQLHGCHPSHPGWETWLKQSRVYSCLTPGVSGIDSMTLTRTEQLLKMNAHHTKETSHRINLKRLSRNLVTQMTETES